MLIAGHTHRHCPLSTLDSRELEQDVTLCRSALDHNVLPQNLWPFSYPYGKRNSYNERVIDHLIAAGYDCSFGTEAGQNVPGSPLFELFRVDCNGAVESLCHKMAAAS